MNPIDEEAFNTIVSGFYHTEVSFKDTDEVYIEPVPEADLKEWDCW